MSTKKQAIEIFEKLKQNKPSEFFDEMNTLNSGMRFILICLYDAKSEIYASTLSEKMKISRARVAILLKKLLAKNFITKQMSPTDSRKEVLKITPMGINAVEEGKKQIINHIEVLIDNIGIEKLNAFIDIASEIQAVVKNKNIRPTF